VAGKQLKQDYFSSWTQKGDGMGNGHNQGLKVKGRDNNTLKAEIYSNYYNMVMNYRLKLMNKSLNLANF